MTVHPPLSTYRGRTLAYVRRLTDNRFPVAASVKDYVREHPTRPGGEPHLGDVVAFDVVVGSPGDVGLYSGAGLILVLTAEGFPRLRPLRLLKTPYYVYMQDGTARGC